PYTTLFRSGYGHAPEHISLWCPEINVFISGDMLLPRISTNVSVQAYEPGANPLTLYLRSLDRYEHIHEDAVVLPSHGRPFRGVHERIRQQHEHHDERSKETYDACANGGLTAAELGPSCSAALRMRTRCILRWVRRLHTCTRYTTRIHCSDA